MRFLSEREVQALIAALPTGTWQRAFVLTCLLAGLRSGEARGLRWPNVDLPAGRIRVREQAVRQQFGPLKTPSSERDVVIHESLAEELAEYSAHAMRNSLDLVFSYNNQIMSAQHARYHLKGAAHRAGVSNLTPHDLRRTYGSILIAAGADVTFVQAQLGHASPHVTLTHYAALWDERRNVSRVDEYLRGVNNRDSGEC